MRLEVLINLDSMSNGIPLLDTAVQLEWNALLPKLIQTATLLLRFEIMWS